MNHRALYLEKLQQAGSILAELGHDAWLIFVRETALTSDPITELLWDFAVIWPAAIIITADGQRVATGVIHDESTLTCSGLFTDVIPFEKTPVETLPDILRRLDPGSISLNYSETEASADGLSYGLYLSLQRMLEGTPYVKRFCSAERLIGLLRQRKLPTELARLRAAVRTAGEIFDRFNEQARPGMSEIELSTIFQDEIAARNLGAAWDAGHCPNLNAGPHTGRGHLGPRADVVWERGQILNIDFGVKENGYCSDQQRMWYALGEAETSPPAEVLKPFYAVRDAIQAGFEALRPGVEGWRVDAAARESLTGAGYPEYLHSLGHNVGRYAHDGGVASLSPRWPSYGERPYGLIEPNQVLTLELGIWNEAGYYGLEEEVLVAKGGAEWLWPPQRELYLV